VGLTDRTRHKYRFDLVGWSLSTVLAGVVTRTPDPSDSEVLANLMLDAYLGTIDYEGENVEDARAEIEEFFSSDPMLDCSRLIEAEGVLVAASLLAMWERSPLVAYVMTASSSKRHGLARAVLLDSLDCVASTTHREVFAFITEGNTASERLFASLGAVPLD
jgi:hypothetical protein